LIPQVGAFGGEVEGEAAPGEVVRLGRVRAWRGGRDGHAGRGARGGAEAIDVGAEDCERVADGIIDALPIWIDPATGERPVALALKRQDARLPGLRGATAGDAVLR
jgi:hypothetical protein